MRTYDYGRRRIAAGRLKQWERTKVTLLLSGGAILLGVIFYLLANR